MADGMTAGCARSRVHWRIPGKDAGALPLEVL